MKGVSSTFAEKTFVQLTYRILTILFEAARLGIPMRPSARHVQLVRLVSVLALALLLGSRTAHATSPRLRIQKVEAEPMPHKKLRLTLLVSPVEVEGTLIRPDDTTSWSLIVDGETRGEPVEKIVTWKDEVDEAMVVFCVQVTSPFDDVLSLVADGGKDLLKALGERARVAVIPFGESMKKANDFLEPRLAGGKLSKLTADETMAPQPRLQSALKAALDLMEGKEATSPERRLRKMIIVVSDGFAEDSERDKFRKLGKRAHEQGVVIHSIAYAPLEEKAPLLNLGEISKVSHGTFRWAKIKDAVKSQFETLKDEIVGQPAVSFIVPEKIIEGGASKLKLVMNNLTSKDEYTAPFTACKEELCAPGWRCDTDHCVAPKQSLFKRLGWILWVGLGLIVLVIAFFVLKWYAARLERQNQELAEQLAASQPPPGVGGAPGVPGAHAPGPGVPGYTGMGMSAPVLPGVPGAANANAAAAEAAAKAALIAAQVGSGKPQPGHKAPKLASYDPNLIAQQAAAMQAAAAAAQQAGQHGGRPQAAAPAVPYQHQQPQHVAPTGAAPSLLVMSGPYKGQRLPLMHGFTVGKTPGVHFLVQDSFASGHHAQFTHDTAGNYTITDLNSTNGTFVNGVRIRAHALVHGNMIQIGQVEFRYLVQ